MDDDFLCVLDFYISSSYQRRNLGHRLFLAMLEGEGVEARALAFDKPSFRLHPFLKKHFGLEDFVEQPNQFVVFEDYFEA